MASGFSHLKQMLSIPFNRNKSESTKGSVARPAENAVGWVKSKVRVFLRVSVFAFGWR